jgi:hypothetical protein
MLVSTCGVNDTEYSRAHMTAMINGHIMVAATPRTPRIQCKDGMIESVGASHELYQTTGINKESIAKNRSLAANGVIQSRRCQSQMEVPIAINQEAQEITAREKWPCQVRAVALPNSQDDPPTAVPNHSAAFHDLVCEM